MLITVLSKVLSNWHNTATDVELRIVASTAFVSSDGTLVQPAPFYQSVTCVPDLTAHTLTIPEFTIWSTPDALDLPNIPQYTFTFTCGPVTADPVVNLSFGTRLSVGIPISPTTTTLDQIEVANAGTPTTQYDISSVINQSIAAFYAGVPLPVNDPLPSIAGKYTFYTRNTATTNITNFLNPYNQKVIWVFIGDSHTSIFGVPRSLNAFLQFGWGVDEEWHEITSGALGVQSINGNSNPAQSIVIGTDGGAGSAPNIASSGGTTTVNIPEATQTITGTVNATTQTFGGIKRFTGPVTGSTSFASPAIVIGDPLMGLSGEELLTMPNSSTGTTQNRLAKLVNGQAQLATTADTAGIIGPVQGSGGTSGVCTIAVGGVAQAAADGAWAAGNFAIPSVIDDGKVHDAGASRPTTAQTIGRFTTSGGSAGNARLLVFGPEIVYGGSGGGGSNWGVFNPVDYGAVGDGSTNDTTAFLSMLTAIGSEIATVIIPKTANATSQFLLGNITFPANITLDFFPGGAIKVVTGRTVLIQGQVISQANQIFFNVGTVAAGLGLVSFGNTSATNSTDGFTPQQKDYWAEWWGAVGDNTTHSADFLDAAFEALPNGSTMRLAGKFYYLEHGVTFGYKFQCSLIGNDSDAGYSDNLTKPIFVYQGSAGGTVFTATNVYTCTFKGFGIYGSNGSSPTNKAATNFLLTYTAGGYPSITSHCYLECLTMWALSTRTDWTGILITNSGGNNEHHTIRECTFVGQQSYTDVAFGQAAINLGQTQVQRLVIDRNNFSGLSVGVSVTGNMMAYNNIFSNVATPWYFQNSNNNCLVIGDDIELSSKIVDIVGTNGPFTCVFMACKYASIGGGTNTGTSDAVTTAPIRIRSNGSISFYNCNLNNAGAPGQDFGPFLVGGPNNGSSFPSVEFYNCLIGTAQSINIYAPGFSTCSTRYVSGELDVRWGGATAANENLLSAAPPTKGALRPIIELQGPTATTPADPVTFGGALGVGGLYPAEALALTQTGATGASTYRFAVIALDSAGRRTGHRIDAFVGTTLGPATLNGTNYLTLTWYSITPAPNHYEVYDIDPNNSANWRFVASVAPTGAFTESYNIQANPSGAYVATQPTFNEAGLINFRNVVLYPMEVQFADGAATPSIAIGNDFYTANSAATTITNFTNGTAGQVIRVRVDDANTTIANNASIITGTGANIVGVQGAVYSFIFRSSVWHGIGMETSESPISLTDNGTTIATNAALGNDFRVTALTANVTLSNPTNPTNGQVITWEIIQNASAAKTLALGAAFTFGAEITAFTISTTLSSHNFLTAVYNSTTTKWYVRGALTGY